MKQLGLILIAIAIGVGLILPWAQLNFEGEEAASIEFADFHKQGKGEGTVLLKREDNPLRIRFSAKYINDALLPPVKIPVIVKLSDRNGTLIGSIISFPTQGRVSGPEQEAVRAGSNLDATIENDGLHKLELEFAPNKNDGGIKIPAVSYITASFVANAKPLNNDYKIPALFLGLLGFYLIVRSRKNKKGGNGSNSNKPKWGRGGA